MPKALRPAIPFNINGMDMWEALHYLNVCHFVIARLKEKLCFYPNFRNYYFAWLPFWVQIKHEQSKTEFIRILVKLLVLNSKPCWNIFPGLHCPRQYSKACFCSRSAPTPTILDQQINQFFLPPKKPLLLVRWFSGGSIESASSIAPGLQPQCDPGFCCHFFIRKLVVRLIIKLSLDF